MKKVILIHGNGGATAHDHWFPYATEQLKAAGIDVVAENFPDSLLARASNWLPFIDWLGTDDDTVLVGHSSGAIAAMRYAEKHKLLGSVLVSTYATDLGMIGEKLSGYFSEPWDWEAIKNNQRWIVQFASNDPYIPEHETETVRDNLGTEFHFLPQRGHFINQKEFPELVEAIKAKLGL